VAYAVSEAVLWEACDLLADALVLTLLARYFCVHPYNQGDCGLFLFVFFLIFLFQQKSLCIHTIYILTVMVTVLVIES